MTHEHRSPKESGGIGGFLRSRTGLVLIAFLLLAGFYVVTEHMAHAFGVLPYGLLLLCPFLHLLMHGRHGGHGGQGNGEDHSGDRMNRPEGGAQ